MEEPDNLEIGTIVSYCANCGSELAEGASFCTQCGHSVTANPFEPTRRSMPLWARVLIGVGAVVIGLPTILVATGFLVGGAGFGNGGERPSSVGEPQQIMPTKNHVPEGQRVAYNTVPPTSGDHYAQWSTCKFFRYTIADERIVHNLEHSNIIVSYNLATSEEVARLRAAYDDIGPAAVWGLARPYKKIPEGTVAVAAWGVLDTMEGVDRDRLAGFFETYAGATGPERIVCGNSGVTDPPPGSLLWYRPKTEPSPGWEFAR